MYKSLIVGMTLLMSIVGCSSVQVTKDPDERSSGIRFYRPKPYLMVSPADPTGRMVKMKLHYLPDYSDGEYLVKVRGNAKVALQDGWNLVGVNGEAPSPPNAPQEGAEAGGGTGAAAGDGKLPEMVVAATNVPIGFYESVLEPVGKRKVFRGWRYVGFSVMGGGATPGDPNLPICGHPQCPPTDGNGRACRYPEMPQPVFGMVAVNGVMTFREIGEIAMNNGCPFYVETPKPMTDPANNNKEDGKLDSGTPGGGLESGTPKGSDKAVTDPKLPKPNAAPGSASNTKSSGSKLSEDFSSPINDLSLPPLPPASRPAAIANPSSAVTNGSTTTARATAADTTDLKSSVATSAAAKKIVSKPPSVGTVKPVPYSATDTPYIIGPKTDSSTFSTSFKSMEQKNFQESSRGNK